MKTWSLLISLAAMVALPSTAPAQEEQQRFPILQRSEMTQLQREVLDSMRPQTPPRNSLGSPFNVWLRSPEVGEHLQQVGSYIRFKSVLGAKLNEFAILITARQWGAQYEWHAHHRLALQAGLNPAIADAVARGQRPGGMSAEEEAIYDFSTELHANRQVSDATFKAVADRFGEQGVMDLIAVNGYYTLIAMVLNVDRTPVPGGAPLPLK